MPAQFEIQFTYDFVCLPLRIGANYGIRRHTWFMSYIHWMTLHWTIWTGITWNRDQERGWGICVWCKIQRPPWSKEWTLLFISTKEILSDEPPLPEAAGPELDVWPPVDLCAGEKSPASTSKSLRHDSGSRWNLKVESSPMGIWLDWVAMTKMSRMVKRSTASRESTFRQTQFRGGLKN